MRFLDGANGMFSDRELGTAGLGKDLRDGGGGEVFGNERFHVWLFVSVLCDAGDVCIACIDPSWTGESPVDVEIQVFSALYFIEV